MAEIFGALILTLAGGAALAALLTTLTFLLPALAGRTARTIDQMPGRSFVLGAVNALFLSVVIIILTQIGDSLSGFFGGLFTLAGLVLAFLLLLLLTVGLTGLLLLLNERTGHGGPTAPGRTLRNSFLLIAAALSPVAGWFVLTPLALLTGLGAAIIALIRWPRKGGEG